MTPRQNDVYLIIDEYWKKFGYGPTVDDVMDQMNIKSRASVHRMMMRLVELGVCRHLPNKARTIRPVGLRVRGL